MKYASLDRGAVDYSGLAIPEISDLVFGSAPKPVTCGFGVSIGAGAVLPEVNFTLPALTVSKENWADIVAHYEEMATNILKRIVALRAPGVVLEFELLPAMTEVPEWGAEITALLHRKLADANSANGVRGALRVTPTDIRDQAKPPELRTGPAWERLQASFDMCVDAGADILSIESVGGKEVHDPALLYADLKGIVYALGVLAPRDVAWLWERMTAACARRAGTIPGGDTACGFANTAMQLAHQKMLPEVLAAMVRAMSAVRSLAAFEHGAVGPSKDCAYEGPVIKAITGCPISMEGKSATCAHFSPVGNVAAAMCDLWSNESVQNVRLLSGNAPEAYAESLVYDCRLMNVAASRGRALDLRDWLTESDEGLSPQAALLSPDATLRIAAAIVAERTPLRRVLAAGRTAVAILDELVNSGRFALHKRETQWLDRLRSEFDHIPDEDQALYEAIAGQYGHLFSRASYGLEPL